MMLMKISTLQSYLYLLSKTGNICKIDIDFKNMRLILIDIKVLTVLWNFTSSTDILEQTLKCVLNALIIMLQLRFNNLTVKTCWHM